MIRLGRGLKKLDIFQIMQYWKHQQFHKLEKIIKDHPEIANSTDQDLTGTEKILWLSFTLKVLKLLILISSISYFFAMSFKIVMEVQEDFAGWNFDEENGIETPEHFYDYFKLEEQTNFNSMLILMYFSMTSLTTIGLGDYTPRSDLERIYIALGLLFGVAIFSYIMGEFVDMIRSYNTFANTYVYENGDDLAKFFGVIKNFNNNQDLKMELKRSIEAYFEHRWTYNKNIVFIPQYMNEFMCQLPNDV